MGDIQRRANIEGFDTLSIYARGEGYKNLRCVKVGGFFSFWFHVALTTVFDKQGHGSYFKTKKIVDILRREKPDIIHLHNIHGYYLNYPLLFRYLKDEFKGKIVWTFHDCWPFTGHCAHFTVAACDRWQEICYNCPNKTKYPVSLIFDSSNSEYKNKKEYFTGLNDLTITTPSYWLKELVCKSFMGKYEVKVVNNWINSDVFKPTFDDEVLKKYSIPNDKRIILGVANVWDERKGLRVFKEIANRISDDYSVVCVGLSSKQINALPDNVIGVLRTDNQRELAVLYSNAAVYINPSKEETFSLTVLEAISCSTPVIGFDTSAVKELINDDNGLLLFDDDIDVYINAVYKIASRAKNSEKMKAFSDRYNANVQIGKFIEIYNS
ncbi:MAG: glycosyltransferase [Clostridia bacterium]|nr:glycosyltransferase [Clostridia bacterium]